MMTYTEMRQIALGAARSYLREHGIVPEVATEDDAERALDEICRTEDSLTCYVWWVQCESKNQTRLFRAEWRKWQHEQLRLYHTCIVNK